MNKQNQEFPPTPKKRRVDNMGNDRRKLYLKQGGTTMTFVKGITENQAKIVENTICNILEDLNLKSEVIMVWKP